MDYAEDRIVRSAGGLYKVQTRLLDDDEPGCWHTLDGFVTRETAEQIIAARAAIRARVGRAT